MTIVRPRGNAVLGWEPTVSVAITCYNYGRFLRNCVDSVLSQSGVDVDVTIVDDCSTDNSLEVARGVAREDARVTVIEHDQNLGPVLSVNEALSHATGKYILKLDADDMIPPGSLARSVHLLEEFPGVSLVYGRVETFVDDPPPVGDVALRHWSIWAGQEWIDRVIKRGHNVIRQPEAVFRRAAYERVGGHREDLPVTSDMAMWLRLATTGSVGRVNGPVQGFYRVHGASLQRTQHAGLVRDYQARLRAFESLLVECGGSFADVGEKRRLIHQTMAADALRVLDWIIDARSESAEPVDELLDEARLLDPSLTGTRQWRIAVRRLDESRRNGRVARRTPAAFRRSLEDRRRWRRWRRCGL